MPDTKKSICWLGQHNYTIHKELDLTTMSSTVIGTVIISRCTNCGKIIQDKIRTVEITTN